MNGRIRFISVIIILLALVVSVRLYFIQVVYGESFVSDAQRQNVNENTVLYNRGNIYFQSQAGENVPAAISRSGFTIAINPQIIKNSEKVYKSLQSNFDFRQRRIFSQGLKKNDVYEKIAIHLNTETADKIKALNIYGLTISTDKLRFYPGGKLAAHAVGFVAYKENELAGRYGLERYYEDVLKETPQGL